MHDENYYLQGQNMLACYEYEIETSFTPDTRTRRNYSLINSVETGKSSVRARLLLILATRNRALQRASFAKPSVSSVTLQPVRDQ